MSDRTCSIDGGPKKHRARGWCNMHWVRWKRFGDPLAEMVPSATQARLKKEREEAVTGTRRCVACGEAKPLEDFPTFKRGRGGRGYSCKPCRRAALEAAHERRRREDPEGLRRKFRETHLLLKYGMTLNEYESMAKSQRGRCAVCGIRPPQLIVDHDHDLGFVRALLCHPCNLALGFAGDSIERLQKLTAYLYKHKGRLV